MCGAKPVSLALMAVAAEVSKLFKEKKNACISE
jgi:hypothetical protein